ARVTGTVGVAGTACPEERNGGK
ncbi:MAG: hypothetical protein RL644_476, partial [Actinomycetota bacterium]